MQRIQVLKYLVLTTMLMKSDINPFDSQETKPYKSDPRISAMTDLVDAFQRDDIHTYEAILSKNPDVLADPFIAENIDEVSRNMRTKAILKLIAPYTRFSLGFISKHIKISVPEVQDILSFLILDKKLNAKIDQESGTVVVESASDVERLRSLQEWISSLRTLWEAILHNGEGFKVDDAAQFQGLSGGSMLPFGLGDDGPVGSGGGSMRAGYARSRGGFKSRGGKTGARIY